MIIHFVDKLLTKFLIYTGTDMKCAQQNIKEFIFDKIMEKTGDWFTIIDDCSG